MNKRELEEELKMTSSGMEFLEEAKPYEKFKSAKDHICKLAGDYKCWDNRLTHDEALELCKALEAEPCEDAISRQAVDELSKELVHTTRDKADFLCNFWEKLQKLPPVKPTCKKGKWIGTYQIGFGEFAECEVEVIDGFVADNCHCSECGEELEKGERGIYCPNCGAYMGSEEE